MSIAIHLHTTCKLVLCAHLVNMHCYISTVKQLIISHSYV